MAPAKKKAAKKSKKQRAAGGEAEVPFEQALAKLEEAVADLESGELGIDEALAKQILKRAEQKVELLLRDAGGGLTTAPAPGSPDDDDDDDDDEDA
ncbi:MAG: exodeoxyribonuclease VII small subunit [Planctomycetota bacterium]|jgi:exonuclease VII small subunit